MAEGVGPTGGARLAIDNLRERHRGVTPGQTVSYYEAARVCLDRHHEPPAEFIVDFDGQELRAIMHWEPADEGLRGGWANYEEATETGAMAVALAAVELATGLVAIHRAYKGTGADYFLAPASHSGEDLEDCYRLEISGVDKGPVVAVRARLRQKVDQVCRGYSDLPAMAAVVGFACKLAVGAAVEKRE